MLSRNIINILPMVAVVGTVLNTINNYGTIGENNFTFRNGRRIILTNITPFCGFLYSSTLVTKSFNKTILKQHPVTEK